jgi:hypothetical protein
VSDLSVDGRIAEWVLEKCGLKFWTGLKRLWIWFNCCIFKHGNDASISCPGYQPVKFQRTPCTIQLVSIITFPKCILTLHSVSNIQLLVSVTKIESVSI